MSGTKKLVIVESPTKAKTISKYLGDDYDVLSSVGHIRDLVEPRNLPPELKRGSLGKFSVDVENSRKHSAGPTSSTSQLMRTAKEKPSHGTSFKC